MLRLNECDARALRAALEHEYRSFVLHNRLARDFSPAPSVERIRDIEAAHIHTLEVLHKRLGISVPRRPRRMHVHRFRDARHACAAAIDAEREHLAVYRLLLETARDACVLAELRTLERESRDGHIPALRAWRRALRKPALAAVDSRTCRTGAGGLRKE